MRAKEFTITVPITINFSGDGEPEINMGNNTNGELDQNPIFVPPLQQGLELAKATLGKQSPVIDKITSDEPDIGAKEEEEDSTSIDLERIRQLISPSP
jgi:hypothetical protein